MKDLFVSGRCGPTIRKRLEHAMDARSHGPDSEECNAKMGYREAFAATITEAMVKHRRPPPSTPPLD